MLRDVPTHAKSSGSAPVKDILPPAFKAWSGDHRVGGYTSGATHHSSANFWACSRQETCKNPTKNCRNPSLFCCHLSLLQETDVCITQQKLQKPITLLLPFELSPRVSCWCGATEWGVLLWYDEEGGGAAAVVAAAMATRPSHVRPRCGSSSCLEHRFPHHGSCVCGYARSFFAYFQWSFLVNVLVLLSEAESENDLVCPDCSVVVIFVQFCLWLLGSQLNEAAARMRSKSLCLLHLSLLQLLPRLAGLTSPFCVLVVTTNCCSSFSKRLQINSSLGNYNFVHLGSKIHLFLWLSCMYACWEQQEAPERKKTFAGSEEEALLAILSLHAMFRQRNEIACVLSPLQQFVRKKKDSDIQFFVACLLDHHHHQPSVQDWKWLLVLQLLLWFLHSGGQQISWMCNWHLQLWIERQRDTDTDTERNTKGIWMWSHWTLLCTDVKHLSVSWSFFRDQRHHGNF